MRRVLHITHPWGGGIATYINDLKIASGEDYSIYTMKCFQGLVRVTSLTSDNISTKEYYLGVDLKLTDYTNAKYAKILSKILYEFEIDIVQIDSAVGHTFDIFTVPAIKKTPLVCVIHDFFYICPTFHLVNNDGMYCQITCQNDNKCTALKDNDYLYSQLSYDDIVTFRKKFKAIIDSVSSFVFPSVSAKDIFQRFYELEEKNCRVICHGTSLTKADILISLCDDNFFRVGILGSMLKHKGKSTIQSIITSMENSPVKFYHFGDGDLYGKNLENFGRYEQHNILGLLRDMKIDVMLLLPSWPETFSYTLSESIAANIPPIVSNLGALKERVSAGDFGWLVDYNDVKGICNLIESLTADRSEVNKYRKNISNIRLKTLGDMHQDYVDLYSAICLDKGCTNMKGLLGLQVSPVDDSSHFFFVQIINLKLIMISSFLYRFKRKLRRFFINLFSIFK